MDMAPILEKVATLSRTIPTSLILHKLPKENCYKHTAMG